MRRDERAGRCGRVIVSPASLGPGGVLDFRLVLLIHGSLAAAPSLCVCCVVASAHRPVRVCPWHAVQYEGCCRWCYAGAAD
jgi:hypothetical protein